MAVPDQTTSTDGIGPIGMCVEKSGQFGLGRLRDQIPAPWRSKSVSGSGKKPSGARNPTIVSFVIRHILCSARTAARQQRLDMPPNLPVPNFQR